MGKLTLPSRSPAPAIATLIEPHRPTPAAATAGAPAAAPNAASSLLLQRLRLFVGEVARLLDGYARALPDSGQTSDDPRRAAADASETLARAIAAQTMEISRVGSPSDRAAVDELRYLMAAVADELLLTDAWPGRDRFTECLVEMRLFGSSVAGDEIFRRIEALLDDGAQPSAMAPLYLFAISIGFEGRYHGDDAAQDLAALRDALFRKIHAREPELHPGLADLPRHAGRVLSPQAYRQPLSDIAPVRFFRISRPTVVFLASMAVLLALSQAAWLWSSAPVRRALEPGMPAKPAQPAPSEAGRG